METDATRQLFDAAGAAELACRTPDNVIYGVHTGVMARRSSISSLTSSLTSSFTRAYQRNLRALTKAALKAGTKATIKTG